MAVAYIPMVRAKYRDQPPYQWTVNETSPWTPFEKDLANCRVALISTSGAYIANQQEPFGRVKNDLSFREIPSDIDARLLAISHKFAQPDAEEDINCTFPIERLRDLEQERFIGELAPTAYTCMGRIFIRSKLNHEMGPWLIERLRQEKVDVALLVPV
ncbi:MAG: glycine/sarcosine/betaine reductase selenoprotein B family protein [Dehalococcoidia bacterium]|nr:glycine/sarcosine/betaine reductase selenoprotein B family protein [Dehalococcoidia bacterium]